jgi:hypothetical protein
VPNATPVSAERVTPCRDDRRVCESVVVSVDLSSAEDADADEPSAVLVPADVDDELEPDCAVPSVDGEGSAPDDVDAVAGDDASESDVSADATHGVAASPAPMPRANANAPTRPMNLTSPIVVCLSSPDR